MNTFVFLDKAARFHGDRPAIIHGQEVITYREFHQRALLIAGNLAAMGLLPGDRVAFCLANSPRILELIYACFAGGFIVVPVNARLHPKEIAYIVENSGSRVLFHGPEYCDGIETHAVDFLNLEHRIVTAADAPAGQEAGILDPSRSLAAGLELKPEAPAWLFYTSGTTGKPKGALWSHRTIRVVIMNYLADLYNIGFQEPVLHCAPLSHGSGIIALPAVARAAVNIIYEHPSFDPASLFATVAQHRVSHVAFMAPTQIIKCLEDYTDSWQTESLRGICYGGAPMHVEHLKRAVATFGSVFIQLYGQGEAPITIAGMSAAEHELFIRTGDERIASAGRSRTDVEVRCVDEAGVSLPIGEIGEIVARGEVVMDGYWGNPEATADTIRDGWLYTGDVGRFDSEGYLYLLDRSKDVIITGGNNVYPREVEEVIVQHPAVANVVVIGVPDDYWGESVQAVVQLEPGQSCSSDDIIAFCARNMAGYKKPKAVDFVAEFPVSGYGKILRREIRERYRNSGISDTGQS
jgi:acyl-CoA synthetase (AMP-forming)/AMP-acid ligase II